MEPRVYIAGPMSGHPRFNFPAFDAAAERLRGAGFEVISPAELDDPPARRAALDSVDGSPTAYAEATGETWGRMLARDVRIIADGDLDAIVVLPGWDRSRGALLETFVGHALCDIPVVSLPPPEEDVFPRIPSHVLVQAWAARLGDEDAGRAEAGAKRSPASGHETRVTAPTGGTKGAKPEAMALLPWEALPLVARVYDFGARKYEPNNWRRGYAWSLSFSALQRHLAAWWTGADIDPESGESHLAHAAFHILALLTFAADERYAALDDRYRPEDP